MKVEDFEEDHGPPGFVPGADPSATPSRASFAQQHSATPLQGTQSTLVSTGRKRPKKKRNMSWFQTTPGVMESSGRGDAERRQSLGITSEGGASIDAGRDGEDHGSPETPTKAHAVGKISSLPRRDSDGSVLSSVSPQARGAFHRHSVAALGCRPETQRKNCGLSATTSGGASRHRSMSTLALGSQGCSQLGGTGRRSSFSRVSGIPGAGGFRGGGNSAEILAELVRTVGPMSSALNSEMGKLALKFKQVAGKVELLESENRRDVSRLLFLADQAKQDLRTAFIAH